MNLTSHLQQAPKEPQWLIDIVKILNNLNNKVNNQEKLSSDIIYECSISLSFMMSHNMQKPTTWVTEDGDPVHDWIHKARILVRRIEITENQKNVKIIKAIVQWLWLAQKYAASIKNGYKYGKAE